MAVIDLVGTPFPKDDPIFARDKSLMRKVHQVESYIEIMWDLRDIDLYLCQAAFIKLPEDVEKIKIIHAPIAQEAMVTAAVIGYGKLFRSSTCRTVLNARDIYFRELTSYHRFLIDLRDKFIAHQEWNANSHFLHYLKNPDGGTPTLNPGGYTVRVPICGNIDIEKIKECVSKIEAHVQSRISTLCHKIQSSLSQEQIDYLNSSQPNPANPFHKKPAFSSRAAH